MKRHQMQLAMSFLAGFVVILGLSLVLHTPAHAQENPAPLADCTLHYDKTAIPTEVDAGGAVAVTLTLQSTGECNAVNNPVDVILVIDRSGSMSGQAMADAKDAAIRFVQEMDLTLDQVGVASFASTGQGRLDQELSQNAGLVEQKIRSLFASGMTDIKEGLELAETELNSARHRAGNAPVIIILSDGQHNEGPASNLSAAADRIKRSGIRIISVGLGSGIDENQLRGIASSSSDYYYSPTSSGLINLYQSIASTVRVSARNMVITDTLSSHVSLISGSFTGPILPTVTADDIVWQISAVSTGGMVFSYQVAMTDEPGTWPTNDSAVATYLDADGDPATITFPVPQVTVKSTCGSPLLNEVQPTWACQGADVDLTLSGAGFFEPLVLAGTQSVAVQSHSESTIWGTLNANLAFGAYDVTVTNQCPVVQYSNTQPDAFTIYSAPHVLDVRPNEGYNDIPIDVVVCGTEDLAPGTIAYLDVVTGTVALEDQFIQSGNPACIQGTIPAGPKSWEGLREVVLQNACGTTTGAARGKFRILPADLNDDLWGRSIELWLDPSIVVFTNEDVKVGLIVHRRGGKDPIQNLKVSFYEGDPDQAGAIKIGDGTIPLLPPRVSPTERISGTSTSAVGWLPSQGPGRYVLYAVIDPENKVPEDIEDNNVISRTVQVASPLPPDQDQVAPRVDNLVVAGGASIVHSSNLSLEVSATDFAQQGVTPSGVQKMFFVEYIFNEAATIWEPAQSSGWLTYTTNSDWSLVQQSGMRYIQAWVSDGVGKISRYPYQRRFNYVRPCESVSRDGRRVYSVDVNQGDVVEVQVIPCTGDPDLYIWPPDWDEGAPPWVSNRFNDAIEYIRIPPENTDAGTYQVEVYGYSRATYNIQIEVYPAPPAAAVGAASLTAIMEDVGKDRRPDAPAVPASSTPPVIPGNPPEPVDVPTTTPIPGFRIHRPLTVR